ncbi:protein of unknown function [Vibrio tapetis subsp. tapetis]|uniref:Uncharacterized protein n=1 Tax=Vibrio tapetis subsp. tapetis TaxID=1671868 RepID=A0A2N8ZL33_9VIBR|nr:protein of unknown function [Vibrio tapetis subsp. tapetis]
MKQCYVKNYPSRAVSKHTTALVEVLSACGAIQILFGNGVLAHGCGAILLQTKLASDESRFLNCENSLSIYRALTLKCKRINYLRNKSRKW